MQMKEHILAGLRDQADRWDELLAGLSEEALLAPGPGGDWSVKDIVYHLWAWQQRTVARCEAALADREPIFPRWPERLEPEASDVDALNAWLYQSGRDLPWPTVYQNWRAGYQRMVTVAGGVSERDWLDSGRFRWMDGFSLVAFLLASYDHHQEHYDKLQARLVSGG
jgi:hypothetical protein